LYFKVCYYILNYHLPYNNTEMLLQKLHKSETLHAAEKLRIV
jgi:hypothetical protein